MEIENMTIANVEERLAAINEEMRADGADLEALKAEIENLNIRKAELKELETRTQMAEELQNGAKADNIIETRMEDKTMENIELRDTLEYGKAFCKMIKSGDESEVRALLTEGASGSIPVPTLLDNEIRNAWEDAQLLSLVKQTAYPGNIKVGFEYSATGAVVHVEGSAAPEEETLVLGTVTLTAQSIKKWITVSDEAIDNTTIDTLGYLYKEIAQKIAEKAEDILVQAIIASPATSTTTAPGVPVYTAATIAVDTITMALAELSGRAKNVTLAMNRRTYAAFVAANKNNKYGVDVFDGCKVVYTDALPAFSAASTSDTYVIAGDFGYGAQVNKPNGNDLKLTVDDKSLAEKDLVKVVGRMYAGIGVVAPNAFVKVVK